MLILELKDPRVLGEEHETYGFTFWSLTDGDYPVMFNSKNGNILPGTRIMAQESEVKTSKNGTEYLRLKKVSFEEDAPKPSIPFQEKPTPTFNKPAPTFKEDNKYLKDATTVPLDVYRVRANIDGLPGDSSQRKSFFRNVRLDAVELLELIQEVRDGTFEEKTSEMASAKLSGREKFEAVNKKIKGQTEEFGEEDVPHFES